MQARQIKFLGSPKADTITGQMLALSDTVQRAISKARFFACLWGQIYDFGGVKYQMSVGWIVFVADFSEL